MAQFATKLKSDDAARATIRRLRQIPCLGNRGAYPPSMVHSVASPRHPPDTALHPEASIVDAFGMSDQFGKCRLSGKAVTIGTVGSTQPEEFAKCLLDIAEHAECQGVTFVVRGTVASNLKS